MARVACGGTACASPTIVQSSSAPTPARLEILIPTDFTTYLTVAKILKHQLFATGLDLSIQAAPVDQIVQRMIRGDFELAILPWTKGPHGYGFFLSPGHPKSLPMTGFASAEYDAAVDRGDLITAQSILDRGVPATRLFDDRSFAAVDARFCGDVTASASSWLWLSELYPCEEGSPR